jgi:putative salt-induced outer membrane protein YdiY
MRTGILATGIFTLFLAVASVAWAQADTNTWHGDGAFGLSLAKGNANTLLLSSSATAHREWGQNVLKLGADGQYGLNDWGKSNETQSANNVHGFIEYNRFFTERFYGSARIDGSHDDLAEVRYRVIVGPAAGYYFIKGEKWKLNGEVGPSFISERLGSDNNNYVTLRLSGHTEYSFNKNAKVWGNIDYLPKVDDFGSYLLNSEIGAEAAFNARFSLRVVAADKYNSRPATGRDTNDITLISALVCKY